MSKAFRHFSFLNFYWTVDLVAVVVVNTFIVMLNVNLQKRQGHVVCLLYHFLSYLNELHPQVPKPVGNTLLDSYGSPTAVNSVIVIGL